MEGTLRSLQQIGEEVDTGLPTGTSSSEDTPVGPAVRVQSTGTPSFEGTPVTVSTSISLTGTPSEDTSVEITSEISTSSRTNEILLPECQPSTSSQNEDYWSRCFISPLE